MRALTFLMTYGISLDLWNKRGILSREVRIFFPLLKLYDKILIVTYGNCRDEMYRYILPPSVYILNKPSSKIHEFVYSLLVPFIYRKFFKKYKVIVCRTVQLFGCWTGLVFKLLYGTKLILRQGYQFSKFARNEHTFLMYFLGSLVELLCYWLADAVIVTSLNDKEYIVRRYYVNPHKIYVIPNWVDTSLFKPLPSVAKERGRVVFVGRLELQKNLLALVEAVKHIPSVRLYIIGNGSLRGVLEAKIRRKNTNNVVLLGPIPHDKLPWELNKSEIFILPSLWEGHPKTLIEAMACGLPVIGSNVEGIRELIKDGYNGVLCEPTSKSIREVILRLLRDPELRRRLSENARRFVIENFSFENIMRKELALHLWLLKQAMKEVG